MNRWSMSSTSKATAALIAGVLCACSATSARAAATLEPEPMTLRVVAVNPSAEKNRTVLIRIDLPLEVKPGDILEHEGLEVDFDTDRSLYYVHNEDVTLAPKQTKVFQVVVRDLWSISDAQLDGLKTQTGLVLRRLEKNEYYASAKQPSDSILARLAEIQNGQRDETIGRKQRIGAYRRNLLALQEIKDDLARMEKLLSFAGGPPVPQMLEESPLKSDAPSTTTTWLVIFLITMFMALLAGQFFFTWHRRVKSTAGATGGVSSGFSPSEGHGQVTQEHPSRSGE